MNQTFEMKSEGYLSSGSNCSYVKIPRNLELVKKHNSGFYFFRLCSRVAVRSGRSKYYKYTNDVYRGEWVGGLTGLKSILGVKRTNQVLPILDELRERGYIRYRYDKKTKVVTVGVIGLNEPSRGDRTFFSAVVDEETGVTRIADDGSEYVYYPSVCYFRTNNDGLVQFVNLKNRHGRYSLTEKECYDWQTEENNTPDGWIYAAEGKGFFCLPKRLIEQRVQSVKKGAVPLDENEAIFDLFISTTYRDFNNAFSWFAPCVSINQHFFCSFSQLAVRWGWSKTKVSRFFEKYKYLFAVRTLPSVYGSVIYNKAFIQDETSFVPAEEQVVSCFQSIVGESLTGDAEERISAADVVFTINSKSYIKKYFCRCCFVGDDSPRKLYYLFCSLLKKAREYKLVLSDLVKKQFEKMPNLYKYRSTVFLERIPKFNNLSFSGSKKMRSGFLPLYA